MMLAVVPEQLSITRPRARVISQLAHAFPMLTLLDSLAEIPNHVKATTVSERLPTESLLVLMAAVVCHPPTLLDSYVETHNRANQTDAVDPHPAMASLLAKTTLLDVRAFLVKIPQVSLREKTLS